MHIGKLTGRLVGEVILSNNERHAFSHIHGYDSRKELLCNVYLIQICLTAP
jgi:hypothetical protein